MLKTNDPFLAKFSKQAEDLIEAAKQDKIALVHCTSPRTVVGVDPGKEGTSVAVLCVVEVKDGEIHYYPVAKMYDAATDLITPPKKFVHSS